MQSRMAARTKPVPRVVEKNSDSKQTTVKANAIPTNRTSFGNEQEWKMLLVEARYWAGIAGVLRCEARKPLPLRVLRAV
jgi:hypothetical protein